MLGLYSFSPLTPGGWADLLSELGLPDTLRRLTQTVLVGGRRRSVEMRCLAALPGTGLPAHRPQRLVQRIGARLAAGGAGGGAGRAGRRQRCPT